MNAKRYYAPKFCSPAVLLDGLGFRHDCVVQVTRCAEQVEGHPVLVVLLNLVQSRQYSTRSIFWTTMLSFIFKTSVFDFFSLKHFNFSWILSCEDNQPGTCRPNRSRTEEKLRVLGLEISPSPALAATLSTPHKYDAASISLNLASSCWPSASCLCRFLATKLC